MTDVAFTDGPWHWVWSQNDVPVDFDNDNIREEWCNRGGPPQLRTVQEWPSEHFDWTLPKWILYLDDLGDENDIANMKLVAASPDLYKALKHVVDTYTDTAANIHDMNYSIEKAREALSKVPVIAEENNDA